MSDPVIRCARDTHVFQGGEERCQCGFVPVELAGRGSVPGESEAPSDLQCEARFSNNGALGFQLRCQMPKGHDAGSPFARHEARSPNNPILHRWADNRSDAQAWPSSATPPSDPPKVTHFKDVTPEDLDWIATNEIETLEDLQSRISCGPEAWVDREFDAKHIENTIGVIEFLRYRALNCLGTLPSGATPPSGERVPEGTETASVTYGDLPEAVRALVINHEWDNRTPSEQRDWLIAQLDAVLPPTLKRLDKPTLQDVAQWIESGAAFAPSVRANVAKSIRTLAENWHAERSTLLRERDDARAERDVVLKDARRWQFARSILHVVSSGPRRGYYLASDELPPFARFDGFGPDAFVDRFQNGPAAVAASEDRTRE